MGICQEMKDENNKEPRNEQNNTRIKAWVSLRKVVMASFVCWPQGEILCDHMPTCIYDAHSNVHKHPFLFIATRAPIEYVIKFLSDSQKQTKRLLRIGDPIWQANPIACAPLVVPRGLGGDITRSEVIAR